MAGRVANCSGCTVTTLAILPCVNIFNWAMHRAALRSSRAPPFLAGFVAGLSLIVAIGAQNAFVLRQGLGTARRLVVRSARSRICR